MRRRNDAFAFVAERADHRLVGRVHRAEHRDLAFQAEARELLDEARRVRAGLHREHGIDLHVGDLTEIGAEIRGVQRMPELLHDLAAAFGEDLGKAAALLVTEGVILADGRDALVALLERPVAERMREGARRIAGDPHDILDALTLRQVVGRDDRDEIWRAVALDVIRNGKAGIGEKIADQEIDIGLLDQATRLLQGGVRIGCVVLDDQLDLAAGDLVADRSRRRIACLRPSRVRRTRRRRSAGPAGRP